MYGMPYDWKIRVTLPYEDCSGIIHKWYDRCDQAVCYQHESDDEVKKTHIHLALIGCDCKDEALKRMWKEAPGKGNEFWSFTKLDHLDRYITYMTKGKYSAKLAKNLSPDKLEELRQAWVEPTVGNDKSKDTPTEHYISILNKHFDYLQEWADLPEEGHETDRNGFNVNVSRYQMLYRKVRSEGMKMFLGRNKFQTPPKTLFCTVTNSVYVAIMHRIDCYDIAIELILEKY